MPRKRRGRPRRVAAAPTATLTTLPSQPSEKLEFRSMVDDAWYSSWLQLEGETLRVIYIVFPDTNEERFPANQFETAVAIEEFRDRFRPESVPVEDEKCAELIEGMVVCAFNKYQEFELKFYDAAVDSVIISAKEEPDVSISSAMDGLFRVHKQIVNGLDGEVAHAPPNGEYHLPTRLLVPVTQAGSLIGKQGVTIKLFQEASKTYIRVVEELPHVALQDDKVIELLGVPAAMPKALELVANHLRKFLVDRSVLPRFEMNMLMQPPQLGQHIRNTHMQQHMYPQMEQHMHHAYMEQHMLLPQPWGPHAPPLNAGGPCYGPDPQFMPVRQHDNFYPPPDYPDERPPHRRILQYGREALPMGAHPSMNKPPQMSSQATHHMQVPCTYAVAVFGLSGANISYIRRTSGATIRIQESDTYGEMTVEIFGSVIQVWTAQQLILNSIAGASFPSSTSGTAQNQMPSADQGKNSYPDHGYDQNQMPSADQGKNSYPDHGYDPFPGHGSMYASQANAGPGGGGVHP